MPKFTDGTIEKIFGAEDAENENHDRFKSYFFRNKAYENLQDDLPIRILVGHKGIGKSALLRRSYLESEEKRQLAVWIRPNDVFGRVGDYRNVPFNQLIENWKSGLLGAISAKVLTKFFRTDDKITITGRISSTVSSLVNSLMDYAGQKLSSIESSVEREVISNFQSTNRINVYIDDIDRGWSASRDDIRNISALLNAIRDLSGQDSNISFRIGLRTDVYFLVRTSDESTDKIERQVIWLSWTNHEILCVVAKRIETFFQINLDEDKIFKLNQSDISKNILSKVITPVFDGKGHWSNRPIHNVILSLTRKRPRDLVKLFHGASRNAYQSGNEIISSANLEQAFGPYSTERMQDIINEFRSELPDIESLLLNMRPTKARSKTAESFLYSTDELIVKLKEIMGRTHLRFTSDRVVTPKSLIQFLYKIDFITARKDLESRIDRKYFESNQFLANEIVDFGYKWEIHPAYRWAMQPTNVLEIMDGIDFN